MEQKLFSELRQLYATSKEKPVVMRARVRMRDLVDAVALRHALDATMQRYPYFCVELQRRDGAFYFAENHRPVVITHSLQGVELNSAESNYHMIALSLQDNWIILDVFHGLTDGMGAYEVLRTLLYHYCSERYQVELSTEGIRLAGDEISEEEWVDPVASRQDLPTPPRSTLADSLNLIAYASLEEDRQQTVYNVSLSESEFMDFVRANNASPATMVALLLSRAIARLYPEAEDPLRVSLTVNQRKALHAPLAHQSLVSGLMLEYEGEMRDWPLEKQGAAYREMVRAQTTEEVVLGGVATMAGIVRMILSKEDDAERFGVATYINRFASKVVTATVSYAGKANYGEAERYVRDFRQWTSSIVDGLLVEVAAVNGRFSLDFLQTFSSPVFVNAFLEELEEHGITYDLQDVNELALPNVRLPWTE